MVSGCFAGNDCYDVTNSKWSSFLGVPMAALGAVVYGWLAMYARSKAVVGNQIQYILVSTFLSLAICAALWSMLLQVFVLKTYCLLCCVTCGVAFLGAVTFLLSKNADSFSNKMKMVGPIAAMVVISMVTLIQYFTPQEVSLSSEATVEVGSSQYDVNVSCVKAEESSNLGVLSLNGGQFEYSLDEVSVIGDPASENFIVLITDYTCFHCRVLFNTLNEVRAQYADEDLAIAVIPGIRNQDSLNVFRAVLPLWKIDKGLYYQLQDELYEEQVELTPFKVATRAAELVGGREKYLKIAEENRSWTESYLKKSHGLFKYNSGQMGRKVLPQLMIGEQLLLGSNKNKNLYHQIIEKHLDIKPTNFQIAKK